MKTFIFLGLILAIIFMAPFMVIGFLFGIITTGFMAGAGMWHDKFIPWVEKQRTNHE